MSEHNVNVVNIVWTPGNRGGVNLDFGSTATFVPAKPRFFLKEAVPTHLKLRIRCNFDAGGGLIPCERGGANSLSDTSDPLQL